MPNETTPTIIRRYYPTLSSIINSDEIPEVLGFIKDGVQSLIDKIHYKDLQFNKSPRGDAAFYSLSVVSPKRIDIEIPGTGIYLVLNPDLSGGDTNISSFPITVEYQWKVLAYIREFSLGNFSFEPQEIFEMALRILNITEEQALAHFINIFVEPDSDLDILVKLFEEKSRNYKGIDFSGAPSGAKKILITGFDPFFLNEKHSLYGSYSNFRQSNPSGCVALSLHNALTSNNLGYIQAMLIPVRYMDFDSSTDRSKGQGEGIIENYIKDWINTVDMIITISQTAPPFEYNIDKYATATRGGTIDNLGYTRNIPPFGRAINIIGKTELEWLKTTLPSTFIASPVIFYTGYTDKNGNEHTDNDTLPNENPKEQLREGSGGDYLSNEIFYRVAKLRTELRPALATGHFHIKKLQSVGQDFIISQTSQLINIVRTAINNGVTGL